MITPTVGDKVIVKRGALVAQPEGWPAHIVKVHEDGRISAGGFSEWGSHAFFDQIPLLQDDDVPPEFGAYAEWKPASVGQGSAG